MSKNNNEESRVDNLISFEQLRNAFVDALRNFGDDWKEIQKESGLTNQRCKDISRIYKELK